MENIQKTIEKIEQEIKEMFSSDSSGHDIYHLKRTLSLALHLQKKEGGDKTIIAIASFLHDIHRIIQNETGKFCSPKDSLLKVEEILNKIDLSENEKGRIFHCIEFHEEYSFSKTRKSVKDIETLIIQDADNLDAMGAIGIARAFMYAGANNIPMWIPKTPFKRKHFEETKTDISEIHHFYSKLLKLKNNMNTKTAKKLAEKRNNYLKSFLEEFFNEWKDVA